MKRSQGDAFESGYDQPQQLQQQQQPQQQQQQQQQQQLRQKTLISPISKIRIGEWSVEAIHRDHIMLKCYFAKQKLLWEFLDKSAEADSEGIKLKRKMEMDWSHLSSCQVHIDPQDNTGILQVELNKRPTFYIETNQRPGKHTQWKLLDQDFTTNQSASSYAIHTLYFASGELQKNLEKLLSGDIRFWSTLLHIEHPNNNNPNGSTNGLNVNCPNFNMERQQVNWGKDGGREVVVVNSAAQDQQIWGNGGNQMNDDWGELKNAEGNWDTNYLLSVLPPMKEELSCTLQANLEDVNMENMEQLYWGSVYDNMPPLEPIPLTVLKSSDPLREAEPNANANANLRILMYPPQNMESSLDLEYALKTSNPPGETQLQPNSMIAQDPNLQNMEQLHRESTVFYHMPPLEPIPETVMPDLELIPNLQNVEEDSYQKHKGEPLHVTEENSMMFQQGNLGNRDEEDNQEINLGNRDEEEGYHQIINTTPQLDFSSDFNFQDPAYLSFLKTNFGI